LWFLELEPLQARFVDTNNELKILAATSTEAIPPTPTVAVLLPLDRLAVSGVSSAVHYMPVTLVFVEQPVGAKEPVFTNSYPASVH
jgi:hypothetical protein